MAKDYSPSCELGVPGRLPRHGAGWYLIADNARVEAGPFPTQGDAETAARWLDDEGRGVNPAPWLACWAERPLIVGAYSARRGARHLDAHAG